jgi:hypothetical protein
MFPRSGSRPPAPFGSLRRHQHPTTLHDEEPFTAPVSGQSSDMRFGNMEVRPLGGGLGCLLMVLFSIVASVVLTVLVNLLLR